MGTQWIRKIQKTETIINNHFCSKLTNKCKTSVYTSFFNCFETDWWKFKRQTQSVNNMKWLFLQRSAMNRLRTTCSYNEAGHAMSKLGAIKCVCNEPDKRHTISLRTSLLSHVQAAERAKLKDNLTRESIFSSKPPTHFYNIEMMSY